MAASEQKGTKAPVRGPAIRDDAFTRDYRAGISPSRARERAVSEFSHSGHYPRRDHGMANRPAADRMRYFITFACYGARLDGDESGSVDRDHNLFGNRLLEPDERRAAAERRSMNQPPYELDCSRRAVVLEAIRGVCRVRGWNLLAVHVRSNHVHVILECEVSPEKAINDFKAHASRALNGLQRDGSGRRRWARHGSTRWLWKDQDVREAIRYVIEEQGEPMALFVGDVQ